MCGLISAAMRILGWVLVVAGVALAVLSFFIAANAPNVNPFPWLGAGFALAAIGIVVLATQGKRRRDA